MCLGRSQRTRVYVTQDILKVREAAQARENATRAGLSADDVNQYLMQHARRRVGSDQPGEEKAKPRGGGQTPAGSAKERGKYFIWVCPAFENQDTLMRRGYDTIRNWPHYATRCLKSKDAALQGIVMLKALHSETLASDHHALVARILGGFITTSAWITKALSSTASRAKAPEGFQVQGLWQQELGVCLCDGVKSCHEGVHLAFQVLASQPGTRFTLYRSINSPNKAVRKYVADRGIRSRPWVKYCLLALGPSERDKILDEVAEPRLVQTLDAFLDAHSPVKRDVVCPGW